MGDLHPKRAGLGELVNQQPPLVQLALGGQQEAAAPGEEAAQQARQPWGRVGGYWWRVCDQIVSPSGGWCRVPYPGIVRSPAEPFESGADGRLDVKICEG